MRENPMPNGGTKKESPPERSPEERLADLVRGTDSETAKKINLAFAAGEKNNPAGLLKLNRTAKNVEEVKRINAAFSLGKEMVGGQFPTGTETRPVTNPQPAASPETTETGTGATGETLTAPETIVEAHEMWKALIERMKNLSPEEVKLTVNVGWKILKELAPEIARDISKNKKIDTKVLVQKVTDKFLDKIDEMPEGTFKGLRAFKENEPEKFKKFRTGLIEALDTKDFNECSRKLDDLLRELDQSGEIIEEVKGLAEIAVFLRNRLPEELSEEDRQRLEEHQASGYRGLWEKVWPIGSMLLSLLLIGLILTVILALSFSEGKLGGKLGKKGKGLGF